MEKSITLTQPEIELIKFMLDDREDTVKQHIKNYSDITLEFLFEEQDRIISIRRKLFEVEYVKDENLISSSPID